MGYHSNVALAIKTEFIPELLKDHNNIPSVEVKMLLERADTVIKDDCTLYHWDYIKWYGDDVDSFLSNLEDIFSDHWYFIELGEDIDDNKMNGCFYDNPFNLGYVRQITFEK